MVALDHRDELGNRGGVLVIDHHRRPRASRRRDQVPGLLDRLGPANLRGPGRPTTATGRVDVKARTGKLDRDRTTGAARRPRNQPHSHCPGQNDPQSSTRQIVAAPEREVHRLAQHVT
jgi:hypothetical protein